MVYHAAVTGDWGSGRGHWSNERSPWQSQLDGNDITVCISGPEIVARTAICALDNLFNVQLSSGLDSLEATTGTHGLRFHCQ